MFEYLFMEDLFWKILYSGIGLAVFCFIVIPLINYLREYFASAGLPKVSYVKDGIGYAFIKNNELEVVPIKDVVRIPSNDKYVPDEYVTDHKQECESIYLEIPESIDGYTVTSIGKQGLKRCVATCYIKLPSTIRCIKDEAFAACHELVEIYIPDSVGVIGNAAFEDCPSLEKITLGSGLKKIGNSVFSYCSNLTEIHCKGLPAEVGQYTFNKALLSQCKLYVKAEYLAFYQMSKDWKGFVEIVAE